MRDKPLTVYPSGDLRRAVEKISADDHDRPISKVVELAIKAFAVQWQTDKWAAMRLADQFDGKNSIAH